MAWMSGKEPIGRRTTLTVPEVGRGNLSSSLQSKGVALGKFMTKADTINWSVGTRHMLAKASNLETSPHPYSTVVQNELMVNHCASGVPLRRVEDCRAKRADCSIFLQARHFCKAPTSSFHPDFILSYLLTVAQRSRGPK